MSKRQLSIDTFLKPKTCESSDNPQKHVCNVEAVSSAALQSTSAAGANTASVDAHQQQAQVCDTWNLFKKKKLQSILLYTEPKFWGWLNLFTSYSIQLHG